MKEYIKDLGMLLLTLLGGLGVYISSILPDIILSGEMLIFLGIIIGAVILYLRKLISKLTGAPLSDIQPEAP